MARYPSCVARYRLNGQEVLAQFTGKEKKNEHDMFMFRVFGTNDISTVNQNPAILNDYDIRGYGDTRVDSMVELIQEYFHEYETIIERDKKTFTNTVKLVGEAYCPVVEFELPRGFKKAIGEIRADCRYEAVRQLVELFRGCGLYNVRWHREKSTFFLDERIEVSIIYCAERITEVSFYEKNNYLEKDLSKRVHYKRLKYEWR